MLGYGKIILLRFFCYKSMPLLLCIVLFLCTGCFSKTSDVFDISSVKIYRDIPGITEDEIAAIEKLKSGRQSFSYGSALSTESFILPDGAFSGFTALLCKHLSELFGIPFIQEIYSWDVLLAGINDGTIDFTGEMTPTAERVQKYIMTSPVAERSLSAFMIDGAVSVKTPANLNGLKAGFLRNSITRQSVNNVYSDLTFNSIDIDNIEEALEMLHSGDIDVFILDSVAGYNFIEYENIIAENIFPFIYTPVSMTTANSVFEPVISAVNKYLAAGGIDVFSALYKAGMHEYAKYALGRIFTLEEIAYIARINAGGARISAGFEHDYYPVSFFNKRENEFQGIVPDMLNEISLLTGLRFYSANDKDTPFYQILEMLDSGSISFTSSLLLTPERKDKYLWSEPYYTSYYALISRTDYPLLEMPQVVRTRVGVNKGTAYEEMYKSWFFDHSNLIYFNTNIDAMDALERNEIDLVMASENALMTMTNFFEKPGFMINIKFNMMEESYMGFNLNEELLCSIIRKTQKYIPIEKINEYWTGRVYDYVHKMTKERSVLYTVFIAVLFVMLFALVTLFVIYFRTQTLYKRQTGAHMEAAQKAHRNARYMLDTIPVACLLGDKDGRFFDCNYETVRLFKLKDKQDLIDRFFELSPKYQPDGKSSREAAFEYACKAHEEGRCAFDWMHQLLDGTLIPAVVTLDRVGINDEIVIVAYITDMREHKQMTQKIDWQNDLLKAVNSVSSVLLEPDYKYFDEVIRNSMGTIALAVDIDRVTVRKKKNGNEDSSGSLFYQWDNGNFKSGVNSAVFAEGGIYYEKSFFGKTLSGGKCVNSLVRDLSPEIKEQFTLNNTLSVFVVPIIMQDKFWGLVSYDNCKREKLFLENEELILRSASRMIANAIIRNEMTEQLKNAMEQAEQSNRAKSSFLAQVSHEIRTPLNAIVGMTAICKGAQTSERKEYALEKIDNASTHLLGLINDVLDMSKIEANKLELSLVEYNFEKLINRVIGVINFRIDEKFQKLNINIDEKIPHFLVGDDQRLAQVITNLLSNAVKFTHEKGEISLNASLLGENDYYCELRIEVADNGIGISSEQQKKLFSAFGQAESGTSRRFGGTGLGLVISKRIVELMHGRIWIESELGKGSKFIFTIMAQKAEIKNEAENSSEADARITLKENEFAGKHMLLAEDIEINREIVLSILDGSGLIIDCAENGQAALAIISADPGKYDIVLMDVQMPYMDGYETTRCIRALEEELYSGSESGNQYKQIPIIAMTANVFKDDIEACLAAGMNDHIGKPLDLGEVFSKLRKYLQP